VNALSGFGLLQKHELVWLRCFGNVPASKDCNGLWVYRSAYGDSNSPFGWELDHIVPKALGGSDDVSNLRPRHCSGNRSAGGLLGSLLSR
jgi:hypothetical protein